MKLEELMVAVSANLLGLFRVKERLKQAENMFSMDMFFAGMSEEVAYFHKKGDGYIDGVIDAFLHVQGMLEEVKQDG